MDRRWNTKKIKQITMKILLGADHAGFELKEEIKKFIRESGHDVEDMGAHELRQDDDYPEILAPLALKVAEDSEHLKAIVIGGSGQGEAIICNRFPGVRAIVYYGGSLDIIKLSREHNNSNVLSLGARCLNLEEAKNAVKLWLETDFSNDERHVRRNAQLDEII